MLVDPGKQIPQAGRTEVTERLFIWEHKRVWDLFREGRRVEQLGRCYPRLGRMGFKLPAQPQASCVAWRKPWLGPFPTPVFSEETPPRVGGDQLLRGQVRDEPLAWGSADAVPEEMGLPNLWAWQAVCDWGKWHP